MKYVKVLSLAAVAAFAAMAFVGAGTASAEEHEIVLCKELAELCPEGKLWPKETVLLGLAENPELTGNLTEKCEDSTVEGETGAEIASPLPFTITSLEFGELPTPSLGEGCEPCTAVHSLVPLSGSLEVSGEDEYFLNGSGKALLLCPLGINCGFEGNNIKSPISHTGKHKAHEGENLPVIEIEATLKLYTGSSFFCGNSGIWHANYVVSLAHHGEDTGLAWPSLDL
jgi:hypothetical protein